MEYVLMALHRTETVIVFLDTTAAQRASIPMRMMKQVDVFQIKFPVTKALYETQTFQHVAAKQAFAETIQD
jgi:hypothetical protein